MRWLVLIANLCAMTVAILSLWESRRNAEAIARLRSALRLPLGVIEVKLDSDEIVERIREILDQQDEDGEGWKRGKGK